jgi:hypothetical protein
MRVLLVFSFTVFSQFEVKKID